jgi:hypothetical protein
MLIHCVLSTEETSKQRKKENKQTSTSILMITTRLSCAPLVLSPVNSTPARPSAPFSSPGFAEEASESASVIACERHCAVLEMNGILRIELVKRKHGGPLFPLARTLVLPLARRSLCALPHGAADEISAVQITRLSNFLSPWQVGLRAPVSAVP